MLLCRENHEVLKERWVSRTAAIAAAGGLPRGATVKRATAIKLSLRACVPAPEADRPQAASSNKGNPEETEGHCSRRRRYGQLMAVESVSSFLSFWRVQRSLNLKRKQPLNRRLYTNIRKTV